LAEDVTIDGVDDVLARFTALPEMVQQKWKAASERSATRIVALMKRLCPVDQGTLRDSIGWTWGAAPEGTVVLGGIGASATDIALTIYAGSALTMVTNSRGIKFQNARIQEFGTKARPAQPYFYPAWRQSKRGLRTAQMAAIRAAAKELFSD
jgi:HK97 gp10 family phage protein